jgi:hypothetical protein
MPTQNRISQLVPVYQTRIDALDPEEVANLNATFDLSFDEWYAYQNLKSLAQLHNLLGVEDAQYVCNVLGEGGPDRFNRQPLAVKVVLMMMFGELLKWSQGLKSSGKEAGARL